LRNQLDVANPSEDDIKAHFEQFSEFLGDYVPPGATDHPPSEEAV
jgi:hypothetical protein